MEDGASARSQRSTAASARTTVNPSLLLLCRIHFDFSTHQSVLDAVCARVQVAGGVLADPWVASERLLPTDLAREWHRQRVHQVRTYGVQPARRGRQRLLQALPSAHGVGTVGTVGTVGGITVLKLKRASGGCTAGNTNTQREPPSAKQARLVPVLR